MELNDTKCKHFESSFKEGRCPFIEVCNDNCVFVWKSLYDKDTLEQYKELTDKYDDLESDHSDLEDSYADLEREYDNLQSGYDSLQDDYNKLEEDYETLCSKIENNEGEL